MQWMRTEVKVLARIGGKISSEAGFPKRVLRYDAMTESFFWCSGKRYVQDATAALQLTGRSHECNTAETPGTKGTGATLRDGDRKLDESEIAAFRSVLRSVMYGTLGRLEILTVASFELSATESAMAKLKRPVSYCWGSLRPSGSTPGRMCRSTWTRRQRLGRR